jgi:hypothetical protein
MDHCQGWQVAGPFFFTPKPIVVSNNKGCNPFGGCIVAIAGGFIITILLIGAVDSCEAIGPWTSKSAAEGLMKFLCWGVFLWPAMPCLTKTNRRKVAGVIACHFYIQPFFY